jgi:hypothetical protein
MAMGARAYRSYLLDCLARRRVAALCLLRVRHLVRDMRVLLVKYIVQAAEQHEQAVLGMLDFCYRNFVGLFHQGSFWKAPRTQALLEKTRRMDRGVCLKIYFRLFCLLVSLNALYLSSNMCSCLLCENV